MMIVYFLYVGFMFFNKSAETWATELNCCFNSEKAESKKSVDNEQDDNDGMNIEALEGEIEAQNKKLSKKNWQLLNDKARTNINFEQPKMLRTSTYIRERVLNHYLKQSDIAEY